MAHQPELDIFTEDVDVDFSKSKPTLIQDKSGVMKFVLPESVTGIKWNHYKSNVPNKQKKSLNKTMPNIPEKGNNSEKTESPINNYATLKKTVPLVTKTLKDADKQQKTSMGKVILVKNHNEMRKDAPKPKKNQWQAVKSIPAVGGPDNSRHQVKPPAVKFDIDRSNLKVLEGTSTSKKSSAAETKADSAPSAQKEAAKPAPEKDYIQSPGPPKSAPATPQHKPQGSEIPRRMTASSFMNIQHQAPSRSHSKYLKYPPGTAGIPRSFLTPQHQQQIQQIQTPVSQVNPNLPAGPNQSSHGPVWEATINKPRTPSWGPLGGSRFDQLPSGQYVGQGGTIYEQSGQTFAQSGQIYGQGGQSFGQGFQTFEQGGPTFGQGGQTFEQGGQTFEQGSQIFGQDGQTFGQNGQIFGQGGQTFRQGGQTFDQGGQTFGQGGQIFDQSDPGNTSRQQLFVQTDNTVEQPKQQYSPSDAYADMNIMEGNEEVVPGSPDSQRSGSKRLSAFQRLGPVTQPKKPKLTINLLFNKEQAVREVVDQSDPDVDKYTPVHQRPDIQTSLDDTVMKFIAFWPWKKPISVRRTLTARDSKSVMQLQLEQVEELYEKEKQYFQVVVTGYPESWSKEDVLDTVLEAVKGKSFIPCFIEFSKTELKFLVIRCKAALVAIHKIGFVCRKQDVELRISIVLIMLNANQIDFIPRLILRKRLSMAMDGETELNLKRFTLASDVSHFIYFPLNRVANQTELLHLQSSVPWDYLTKLNLSHNRITTLSGLDLPHCTPRLKHLDLSYNYLEKVTELLKCRDLPLNSIVLDGNPLCADYISHERYTKALKMMFSALKEVDGVKLPLHGDVPETRRNYCPPDAAHVVSKVLEVLFPLLDAPPEERQLIEDLYDSNAVMTVTFMYKLRYGPIYKDYRALFSRARIMDEGEMDSIDGAAAIANLIHRWPVLQHDPLTFTVDVLYHTDTTTIIRVTGIMKVTAETLAEDEHLLLFSRTLVLHSLDTVEYKITNEMVYWDLPDEYSAREAFKLTTIRSKNLSLKLDTPPDAELKEKLLEIFMKLTDMERQPSQRCLEIKNWHLKNAIEYFSKLLKLDNLVPLFD